MVQEDPSLCQFMCDWESHQLSLHKLGCLYKKMTNEWRLLSIIVGVSTCAVNLHW